MGRQQLLKYNKPEKGTEIRGVQLSAVLLWWHICIISMKIKNQNFTSSLRKPLVSSSSHTHMKVAITLTSRSVSFTCFDLPQMEIQACTCLCLASFSEYYVCYLPTLLHIDVVCSLSLWEPPFYNYGTIYFSFLPLMGISIVSSLGQSILVLLWTFVCVCFPVDLVELEVWKSASVVIGPFPKCQ